MSAPEKPDAGLAADRIGPPFGIGTLHFGDEYPTANSKRCRTPFSVGDLALQWTKLGYASSEIALSCREQVAIRVAAGWPQWASSPEQLDLDGIMRELAQAQQMLAEHEDRLDDRGDDTAQLVDCAWIHELAGRLIRAGWMAGGDRSMLTVALAVNGAILDCNIVRRRTTCGRATEGFGLIEIS